MEGSPSVQVESRILWITKAVIEEASAASYERVRLLKGEVRQEAREESERAWLHSPISYRRA